MHRKLKNKLVSFKIKPLTFQYNIPCKLLDTQRSTGSNSTKPHIAESFGHILDDRFGMESALQNSRTQMGNADHKTDKNTIGQIGGFVERRTDRVPN